MMNLNKLFFCLVLLFLDLGCHSVKRTTRASESAGQQVMSAAKVHGEDEQQQWSERVDKQQALTKTEIRFPGKVRIKPDSSIVADSAYLTVQRV